MYSPTCKARKSLRYAISLVIFGCLSGILFINVIIDLNNNSEIKFEPTRSAGPMLNRSQMLLAKEIVLEPSLFSCSRNQNKMLKKSIYPFYIVVKTRAVSSGYHFQQRMFTRRSWAQEARSLGIPVIYAIGRPKDEETQKLLEIEHRVFNDILQFNYIDYYYNISIKTAGVLNWFVRRACHLNTPYLYLVDDDVLVNIPALVELMSNKTFDQHTMYGNYITNARPHPMGKWAISIDDYPNETYPDFITGASTLYPSLVIKPIVQRLFHIIEQNQPILFMDDVLITGIIAEELGIKRAVMKGIEDCTYTDLLSRTLINECGNQRRIYVWTKFVLKRFGYDARVLDKLIDKSKFVQWNTKFTQTRNGTAIVENISYSTTIPLLIIFIPFFLILFWQTIRLRHSSTISQSVHF